MFLQQVAKSKLGFNEPTISYGDGSVWEEGDDADDFSNNLTKKLVDMPSGGMCDGVMLSIDDYSQDMEVQVCLHHFDNGEFDPEKNPQNIHIGNDAPPKKKEETSEGQGAPLDDSCLNVVDDEDLTLETVKEGNSKRECDDTADSGSRTKKHKI